MRKLFKSSLVALLLAVSGNLFAEKLTVEPFAIGAGQTATIKFYLTGAHDDIESFDVVFNLPKGVYPASVTGPEYADASVKADLTFNEARVPGVKTGDFELAWRKSLPYNMKLMVSCDAGIVGTDGDWIFAINVYADETVVPGAQQITFYDDETVFMGAVDDYIPSPDAVDVTVSDKFIAPCNSAGYCTICPNEGLDLSGVDAYIVTAIGENSATLKKITSLAAGDAAIVKGSGNVEIPLQKGATTSESGNILKGVQKFTDLSGKATFFLVGDSFVPAAATCALAAGRGYLDSAASAKVLSLSFDDDATAIQSVEAEQNNGVLYNLNGVRVDNAVKGVYIQNGRKVVIK